jgi:GR25 family glycosyltransferase involved in LPS biosynthesis
MKAYIIILKGNEISEKYGKLCRKQAKINGLRLERFDGIDGNLAEEHFAKLNLFKHPNFSKNNRPGVLGCFLSHYYLWTMCMNSAEPYIIFEHDAYLIKKIPNDIEEKFIDVLKLDRHDPYAKAYNVNIEADQQDIEYIEYKNLLIKKEAMATGEYMRGTYSYIIKPNAATKLISWIKEFGYLPADNQMGKKILDIKVTIPTIARLHPDYNFKNIEKLSLTKKRI